MADFTTVVSSRLPSCRVRLRGPDIQDASAVTFSMKLRGGTTVKSGSTVTIEDTGTDLIVVRIDWVAADLDTEGTWDGKFTATVGGLAMKLPNDRFFVVEVNADAA